MSDPAVVAAQKVLTDRINEVKTMKENNEEIKAKLVSELQAILKYLEELKSGKKVSLAARTLYDLTSQVSEAALYQAKLSTDKLLGLIVSIDVDKYNLSYLESIQLPLAYLKKEYNAETIKDIPDDLYNFMSLINSAYGFVEAYKMDCDRYNLVLNTSITGC